MKVNNSTDWTVTIVQYLDTKIEMINCSVKLTLIYKKV